MQKYTYSQKLAFDGLETSARLSSQQVDARAHELLAQLTLDEKIKLMSGDAPFWKGMADMMQGGYADHPWVAGAVPRLGIPGVRFSDGPRGVMMQDGTTFPVSMGRGATFDPALEESISLTFDVWLYAGAYFETGINADIGALVYIANDPTAGRLYAPDWTPERAPSKDCGELLTDTGTTLTITLDYQAQTFSVLINGNSSDCNDMPFGPGIGEPINYFTFADSMQEGEGGDMLFDNIVVSRMK